MFTDEPDFSHLKKLWTLKLVVEGGSLKYAAMQSKISVSAVSQTLSNLEERLGRKLLLRKDRKIYPTSFGAEILNGVEPAFKIFLDLHAAQAASCEIPKMEWLNFGITESLATSLVPRFVERMKQKLPKMKLTLRVGKCAELTRAVKSGDLCMALISENDAVKGVSVFPLIEDRLAIYCSPQHPLFHHGFEAINEIGIASTLAPATGHPLHYSRFVHAIDRNFRPQLASDNFETLYSIAVAGTMAAILPGYLAMRVPALLDEIRLPEKVKNRDSLGKFEVCMISQKVCDPAEDQFLISELKSIIVEPTNPERILGRTRKQI